MTAIKTCIAVDVGGTKLLIGEVRENGEILHVKRYPTGRLRQAELVERILNGVQDYEQSVGWDEERPDRMGIGVIGISDPASGIWKRIDGEFDEETDLAGIMKDRLGVACRIDNDVKAATIAECAFGAAKGCKDMIYINVGTGLAAGIVSNGKVIRGCSQYAGEIGYLNFNMGKGCHIESTASGVGINRRAQALKQEYPDSPLFREGKTISGKTLFALEQAQDPLAVRLFEEMVTILALLIDNLIWTLDPEKIVLGGGMILNDRLYEQVLERLGDHSREFVPKGIVRSALDPAYTGLMGAAAVGLGFQEKFR